MPPDFILWDGQLHRVSTVHKGAVCWAQSQGISSTEAVLHTVQSAHSSLHTPSTSHIRPIIDGYATCMGIYGKIGSQEAVVGYLDELFNYKANIKETGAFVSLAGRWWRGRESKQKGWRPLDLRSWTVCQQWNCWHDTGRGSKWNFEEICFFVVKSFCQTEKVSGT